MEENVMTPAAAGAMFAIPRGTYMGNAGDLYFALRNGGERKTEKAHTVPEFVRIQGITIREDRDPDRMYCRKCQEFRDSAIFLKGKPVCHLCGDPMEFRKYTAADAEAGK